MRYGQQHTNNRHGSTPVSTVLRKSVTFFIIYCILIIKTLSILKFGQYPIWMTRKPRKGDLTTKNPNYFLREHPPPPDPARSLRLRRSLGNRSLFILDPRLNKYLLLAEFSVRTVNHGPSFLHRSIQRLGHKSMEKNEDPWFTVRTEKTGGTGNKCRTHDLTVIWQVSKKKVFIGARKQLHITKAFQ